MDRIIDLDKYTNLELVTIYSEVIQKLKERRVIRTKNVVV